MPVLRLNHAVLYVRDAQRAAAFYEVVLGFRRIRMVDGFDGAVFLQAPGSTNDHDLGLFTIGEGAGPSGAGRQTVGLYHLAWEVDTLAELERIAGLLSEHGALVGASDHGTTKALYAHDPDGIEFEVSWLVPADLLDEATLEARARIGPLDIETEKRRYGAETRGGVGVSAPA
ncbi:MAG TPA: VOC family protein [Acidimicrobiales bacterium]|nr:VOC family protein [Acidimicrobiales bacterium]